jgi:hypothetical protein
MKGLIFTEEVHDIDQPTTASREAIQYLAQQWLLRLAHQVPKCGMNAIQKVQRERKTQNPNISHCLGFKLTTA